MFGFTVPRRAALSVGLEAANPCARFAQASRPRAGPRWAAASRRWRYAVRSVRLRSMMRAVTSATTGWVWVMRCAFTVLEGMSRGARAWDLLVPASGVALESGGVLRRWEHAAHSCQLRESRSMRVVAALGPLVPAG